MKQGVKRASKCSSRVEVCSVHVRLKEKSLKVQLNSFAKFLVCQLQTWEALEGSTTHAETCRKEIGAPLKNTSDQSLRR